MPEDIMVQFNNFLACIGWDEKHPLSSSMIEYITKELPLGVLQQEQIENLTEDRLFLLFSALVAAGKASVMAQEMIPPPQIAGEMDYPSIDAPAAKQWMWVSRRYSATTVSKTIIGGRDILTLAGPGRITDVILIASVDTIGIEIMIDDEVMYSNNYTALLEITRADGKLSAYNDTTLSRYVIKVSDVGFQKNFRFSANCTGTVTFDDITCTYEVLVPLEGVYR